MTAVSTPISIECCDRTSTAAERYALLFGIREFERSLLDLFATGVLAGTTHTCLGQEAVAVGVMSAIDRSRDIAFSNHRGHGHFLAYCGEVERLYLEIMGKASGLCGGRGGSQHLHFRNFYSNGVQGGIVPVATGMAWAEKQRNSGAVAVVFLGDGTLGEGVIYEAFNLASLWQTPSVFVIEHNGYAQSTPSSLQIAGDVAARPRAFGIHTTQSPSDRVEDVTATAAAAVDAARAGGGPQCVIVYTRRLGPHSKGDDTRTTDEMAAAWAADSLLPARAAVDVAAAEAIESRVRAAIAAARNRALSA
jgi:TPP-dependent pyruvate/acetoin dehydrogenase alpha subunit